MWLKYTAQQDVNYSERIETQIYSSVSNKQINFTENKWINRKKVADYTPIIAATASAVRSPSIADETIPPA